MDSIGDYLYLIILVVAGLSSLLKKKKPINTSTSAPVKPKRSWEEILKELTPVQEEYIDEKNDEEFAIPEIEVVATAPTISNPNSIPEFKNSTYNSTTKVERHPSLLKSSNTTSHSSNEVSAEIIYENAYHFNSIEDVRTAFVYAEIFNRKYQ